MVLMALDHASAMIARTHFMEIWGIDFTLYPSIGWWFTRFVSHLCAPGFFFLMGMSMYLFAQKRMLSDWTTGKINTYFLKRGGLILLLMLFLEFPAWAFGGSFSQVDRGGFNMPGFFEGGFFIPSTVLYGLGMCMIIGAFLWKLPKIILGLITVLSFAFSAWYIGQLSPTATFNPIAVFLYTPGITKGAMSLYPVIPWIGVTTFGMLWGKLYQEYKERIYPISLVTGLVFIAVFLGLRFLEVMNFQKAAYHDWISFFTLIKYPPSLCFILITCGINLVLFYLFSKLERFSTLLRPINLFGKTAMFYYIVHLYLYGLLGIAFPMGSSIYTLYGMWLMGLVILYFICQWYLGFKRAKPSDSIWKMI